MDEPAQRNIAFMEKLEERALKAREQFLKEHPHLQSFQDEIDRILAKTMGFENRMAVLAFLIEKKLSELRDSIADIESSFDVQHNKAKVDDATATLDPSPNSTRYLN